MSDDWDPTPSERSYYRSRINGSDVGWLVRRAGKDFIRLNVPQDTNLRPYRADDWISEKAPTKLVAGASARIAYEAHCALCEALRHHRIGRRQWMSMPQEARMKWIKEGPQLMDKEDQVVAQKLFDAIVSALAEYTR